MSLQIVNPPTITSRKMLKISGLRDPGDTIVVSIGESIFPVQYSTAQNFESFLVLSTGANVITARSSSGESVHLSVELKPLEVQAEKVWNGLDDLGILVNVDRLPEEGNYSFKAWQLVSASSYARGGDAAGLLNAALVETRTRKTQFMRLSSGKPFIAFVKSGSIELRAEFLMDTFDLKAGTYSELAPGIIPERVISGDRSLLSFTTDGKLRVASDTRAVLRYSIKAPKYLEIRELAALMARCKNSIKATGEPSCSKGIQPGDTFPQNFLSTTHGCGNGNCPMFARQTFRVEFQEPYTTKSSLGIVPGVFAAEWNGEEYCIDLSWSDLWVLMLSEPEIIQYIIQTDELDAVRHGLNKFVPYLFDVVSYDRALFADDLKVNKSFSIPPQCDVALPDIPMSGGRLNPRLENTDDGLRLRTDAGRFWMGEELYQLFNRKATASVLDVAKITYRFQDTVFRNHAGEIYTGVPGDVSGDGETEELSIYDIIGVSLNGTTLSSSCLLVIADSMILDLSKVAEQVPTLAAKADLTDFLEITFRRNMSEYPRKVQLSAGRLELIIDSTSTVLVTDETISQDLGPDDLKFKPAGEFKIL